MVPARLVLAVSAGPAARGEEHLLREDLRSPTDWLGQNQLTVLRVLYVSWLAGLSWT